MPVVDSLTQSALRSVHAKQNERDALWDNLKSLAQKMKSDHLINLFAKDPQRAARYSIHTNAITLDYSKNSIDAAVMHALVQLANSYDLKAAIEQLFDGYSVNVTENRPALHTAVREKDDATLVVDGKDIMPEILACRQKMRSFIEKLQSGAWLGATHLPITDVVNIGIGGSDLGPQMVCQALQPFANGKVKVHFAANIDPMQMDSVLKHLNPETTLFLVSSKSFTTSETLTNAEHAKRWLSEKIHTKQLDQHFIGITANPARAIAWGIHKDCILPFWAWVGGRFSIWSSIGFPVALSIGMGQFEQFLKGANEMDTHFRRAPLSENMPVILALLGIWYRNCLQAPTLAICPYSYLLRSFPAYIQQLDMESNGKSTQPNGTCTAHETAPIIWGGEGTNAQHAFFQLLHQGQHFIPVDFIVAMKTDSTAQTAHRQLLINCIAQAKALMEGEQNGNANEFMANAMQGNKPSNLLMLNKVDPYTLGQLIALYEHKIFVQGIIWQINSFDQPGVELGKKLAEKLTGLLESDARSTMLDGSTTQWINLIKSEKC